VADNVAFRPGKMTLAQLSGQRDFPGRKSDFSDSLKSIFDNKILLAGGAKTFEVLHLLSELLFLTPEGGPKGPKHPRISRTISLGTSWRVCDKWSQSLHNCPKISFRPFSAFVPNV
jgi:hypothetical protein